MARLLYITDSTPFCIRVTLRHIHLCNQNRGCNQLALNITPACTDLQEKRKLYDETDVKCSYSLDLIYLREKELDDFIRLIFRKCQDYDLGHVVENVLVSVFPTETFSQIIELPYLEKPAEVRNVILRIEHLGAENALYPQAALLLEKVIALEQAITADKTAKNAQKAAAGEEAIARTELRQMYETNYLDGRKLLGVKDVEKIFPIINHNSGPDDEDGTNGKA